MSASIRKAERFDRYCRFCQVCLIGDPETCPECGSEPPEEGWEPLRHVPHPYLGKTIRERYTLDRFLGGGASGRVYRAHDEKLERPFALKILELGGDDEEARLRRFEREVEALSRIRNPHVINIFEALRLEGRAPAMLTEYIAGRTLAEIVADGKHLDVDSTLLLIHQIANGLHEAHTRDVIHRDLKPANVMVEKLPASGSFARILDFGLVHIADNTGQTRGFWGTPLYAAPEQCAADAPITPAADIYSLGCLLFRCIAGRPPFVGETGREVMRAHFETPLPRLIRVAPQSIPPALDELVHSMLCKESGGRPDDMHQVIDEIDRLSSSDRRLSESFVVADASDEGPRGDERESSRREEPRVADGTSAAGEPRVAQLLHRVDATSAVDDFRGTVQCARLDRTGDCAVFTDEAHRLYVTSTRGAGYLQRLAPAEVTLSSVVPDIATGRIIGAEQNGRLLRWRFEAPEIAPDVLDHLDARVFSLAVGTDGKRIYVGTEDGAIHRKDLRVGTRERLHRFSSPVCELHVDAAGEWLSAATLDGELVGLRTDGGGEVVGWDRLASRPVGAEVDAERGLAAAVDRDGHLRLSTRDREDPADAVDLAVDDVRALSIARDGEIYVLSARQATVRVWRVRHEVFEAAL